jgi:hypothetical protein
MWNNSEQRLNVRIWTIACPVSRRVNSPKNDDAKLTEPEPA